jgi:hypothetical protein
MIQALMFENAFNPWGARHIKVDGTPWHTKGISAQFTKLAAKIAVAGAAVSLVVLPFFGEPDFTRVIMSLVVTLAPMGSAITSAMIDAAI